MFVLPDSATARSDGLTMMAGRRGCGKWCARRHKCDESCAGKNRPETDSPVSLTLFSNIVVFTV